MSTPVELVRKYDTENLIEFLKEQKDLQLGDVHFEILRDEEITGRTFLKTTKDEFRILGMTFGPASALSKRLRYDLDSDGIESIPLFTLPTYEIQDNDKYFARCMAEILVRLKNYGTLLVDSLEVYGMNTSFHSHRNQSTESSHLDTEEFIMRPQYEITGEKSTGQVDYAIKETEDLICVTEDKQHKVPRKISCNWRARSKQTSYF
ncbi:1078_t:CDS:2 [Paraglomus occultum]|uniref:1078_t:CDS:1 n=1 Tax=Paraglomus occultum TaxID=144539 RepID=A0A9N9A8E1_9GLOM|nr:1078_t:CDS:2 [Paraglomus occultum]